jgi:hypothetical protein
MILTLLLLAIPPLAAQAPASPPASQPAPATAHANAPAQQKPAAPSTLLQPSLDAIDQTVGALKLDKWKGGTVRTEAGASISSIQQDLHSTLPPLLQQADAAPGAVTQMLPVLRNVDALYEVLAHVYDAARVAAPGDQVDQLQQAAVGLEKARHALVDHLESAAAAQEKQVVTLQASLKAQPVPVCPVAPAPVETKPATAPAHKTVKKKAKPAVKTPPPDNSQPAAKPAPSAQN